MQTLPSVHVASLGKWTQFPPLQPSSVHTLPSLQFSGVPDMHVTPAHMSPVVQGSPSSQDKADCGTCWQPLAVVQPSTVHGLPSSQEMSAPTHCLSTQPSPVVQALLSLHAALFAVCAQVPPWHASSVHTLLSLHDKGAPALHTPVEHVSPIVQGSPSSHDEPPNAP